MVLGMSLSTFTLLHIAISLIAIVAGFVVAGGMLRSRGILGWNAFFLVMTFLTSATGFLFPFERVLPSHIVGGVSIAVLAIAAFAMYGARLAGAWRGTYVVTALVALWFNVFVLIAQAFLKVGPLHALAPTGSEPAFITVQAIGLAAFVVLGTRAFRAFHPADGRSALRAA